ncbi:hypothetical protein EKO27_g11626 [Xylaria grammica]|uniref:Nephrocystin 3-like N-terminal domain-containing protein n=1 Tax=Xylaria grammica TaxID=363999 RepID=A0A439CMV8_9PEZI|nr:hypothetical protein EKO27_g11626 [Xylaria grammica]
MFRWYWLAARCYVYLPDVSTDRGGMYQWQTFRSSRWFKRGWTLQELIAPYTVEFFSAKGRRIGDKRSLEKVIHEITGIPTEALRGIPLSEFSRRERMLWAEGRITKFEEDRAYSLLGIFEVHLPLIYGEGVKNAFRRLEEEIDKQAAFQRGQPQVHQPLKLDPCPAVPPSLSQSKETCLQSLWFPNMNNRRLNLEKPAEQTCLWLFEHGVYRDWFLGRDRGKHYGLICLKGKPGTGKSILMKEAFRRAVLGQDESDYWTAAFFFNAKGDELESSPLGLFRSLLHQLLSRDLEYFQHFRRLWREKEFGLSEQESKSCLWLEPELRSFFQSMFAHQRFKRTIIFIDALDECDPKRIRSQVSFWREITKSAKAHLSVCLSIRDFPHVTIPNCPKIFVEDYNSHDIAAYVKQKFTLSIAAKEPQWELLNDKILRKSAGVFLWVVLVVDDVLRKWDDGDGVHSLLNQLDVVPDELEALYSQMFSSLDERARFFALRFFQWAILAVKPLRLHEWHHIMAFIRQPILPSLFEWRRSDNFTKDDDQLEKQIRSLSKGLVEVKTNKDEVQDEGLETISVCAGAGSLNLEYGETRVVQVIHESVREFFLQKTGFFAVDPGYALDPIGYGHLTIMTTCLTYINIKELDALIQARDLVEKREECRLTEDLPAHKPNDTRCITDTSISPKATDKRSEGSLDEASPLRGPEPHLVDRAPSPTPWGSWRTPSPLHRYVKRKRTPPPYSRQIRRKTEQASVFEVLKESSDPKPIDMIRWLETLPTGDCVVDPIPGNESARNSPMAPSVTGQSQVLEDYPALLSYITSAFFTHARLAEERGADPSPIINRLMQQGSWARWVTLREDVPRGVELSKYAADQGLSSWANSIPQPTRPEDNSIAQSRDYKYTQPSSSKPAKRAGSVASFSSAGSHG